MMTLGFLGEQTGPKGDGVGVLGIRGMRHPGPRTAQRRAWDGGGDAGWEEGKSEGFKGRDRQGRRRMDCCGCTLS